MKFWLKVGSGSKVTDDAMGGHDTSEVADDYDEELAAAAWAKLAELNQSEHPDKGLVDGLLNNARSKTFTPVEGANSGEKFDAGKLRMSLVPPEALIEIAKVLTFGENKYPKRNNWRFGMAWSRPLDAAYRHINKWQRGEIIDDESLEHHLAHAIVNLMFLLVYEMHELGEDDVRNTAAK